MTDESPRLLIARRGFSVDFHGKALLSTIDPIGQAERLVPTVPLLGKTLYFCPSPLFGYGLRSFLAVLPPDSVVLCIEREESLMALTLEHLDPDLRADPRLRFLCTRDARTVCSYTRGEWGPRRFRRIRPLRLSGAWRIHEAEYDALERTLERDISLDWTNAMTLSRLGRLFARNAVRNLPLLALAQSLSALRFGADPVLLLGAGPSLDGALKAILARFALDGGRFPFRVACVDTALPCLLERGIKPDLCIALESQHWNLRDFIGAHPHGVALAMDLSALPSGSKALGGARYLFYTPWTDMAFLDRLEKAGLLPLRLPPLGSVGLSATAAVLAIGTGPVVAAGLDFAYSLDSYHARGSPGHRERLNRTNRLRSLTDPSPAFRPGVRTPTDKNGLPIHSDPALMGYRDLFERDFAGTGRIYDLGGTGLSLGIPRLDAEAAARLLGRSEAPREGERIPPVDRGLGQKVAAMIDAEERALTELKEALTGGKTLSDQGLENRIDFCDYLWAHFPDCAGAEGRRPAAKDPSFLKRVRAEIDPFLRAFRQAKADLSEGMAEQWYENCRRIGGK